MRIRTILPFVVTLAISIWSKVNAGEEPTPASAGAETSPVAKATADYDAAVKAAKEAEAAVVPLRAAMQAADAAYANASKAAIAARQRATDAKNLAGEQGAAELTKAEADVPAAIAAPKRRRFRCSKLTMRPRS